MRKIIKLKKGHRQYLDKEIAKEIDMLKDLTSSRSIISNFRNACERAVWQAKYKYTQWGETTLDVDDVRLPDVKQFAQNAFNF